MGDTLGNGSCFSQVPLDPNWMSIVNRELDMAVWGCYYLSAVHHHQQNSRIGPQAFSHHNSNQMMVPEWRIPSSTKKRKHEFQQASSNPGLAKNSVSSSNVPSYKCAKISKLHQHNQQPHTSTSTSATLSHSATPSTPSSTTIATSNISSTLTSSSSKPTSSSTPSLATAGGASATSGGDTSRLLFDRRGRGVTFRPYTDSLLECSVLKGHDFQPRGGQLRGSKQKNSFLFGYVGCDGTLVTNYQNSNYYLPLTKNHPRGCMTFRNGDNLRERVEVEKSYTHIVKTTIGNLFPEILSIIFEYLDVPSKGRAAQVKLIFTIILGALFCFLKMIIRI